MTSTRPGRRPGDSRTRDAILTAAAARFAEHGYRDATMRAIAADAGVDPALVHYFFGTKDQLFAKAMALPLNPAEIVPRLLEPGIDGLGERIVTQILTVVDELGTANPMLALIRSATSHPDAARMMREFFEHAVIGRIAAALDTDRPRLRAALCASQIVGLVVARELIAFPPLPETDRAMLAAACGAALQLYLTQPLSSRRDGNLKPVET